MAALKLSLSSLPSPSPSPLRSPPGRAATFVQPGGLRRGASPGWAAGFPTPLSSAASGSSGERALRAPPVRSSLEIARPTVGTVTQVDKDTFWPLVKAAGNKVVVLDMYTQWCGPCKVMAPKFQELSEKCLDVLFLKLDCNQENKLLAKELGIKVVPTFKILKDGKVVKEVKGAKFDELVVAIETARST
uniref:Thioredoxin F-type, chloroplastic n=1 Tax=Anthurium amnicola TaxID=1678845 RepID=A0A1D1XQF5_9ARAE